MYTVIKDILEQWSASDWKKYPQFRGCVKKQYMNFNPCTCTVVFRASAHSPGKHPFITFQGINIAASIQMYGSFIPGKYPWVLAWDTTVLHYLPLFKHYWFFTLILFFSQSTCECVKYYYVSKKSENFKQLARKASFKRKKTFVKSTEMLTLPCSNHALSTPPHSMLLDSKQDSLTGVKPPSGTHTHINTAN